MKNVDGHVLHLRIFRGFHPRSRVGLARSPAEWSSFSWTTYPPPRNSRPKMIRAYENPLVSRKKAGKKKPIGFPYGGVPHRGEGRPVDPEEEMNMFTLDVRSNKNGV